MSWIPDRQELYVAVKSRNEQQVQNLLQEGTSPNATDEYGMTPLCWASHNQHDAMIQILLDHGADVNAQNKEGWTPLHRASFHNHVATIRILLEHGADVDVKDNGGWTPLHLACQNGHEAVVQLLLEYGADITASNNDGKTPFGTAESNEHLACVTRMLPFVNLNCETRTELDSEMCHLQQVVDLAITSEDEDELVDAIDASSRLQDLVPMLKYNRFLSVQELQNQFSALQAKIDKLPNGESKVAQTIILKKLEDRLEKEKTEMQKLAQIGSNGIAANAADLVKGCDAIDQTLRTANTSVPPSFDSLCTAVINGDIEQVQYHLGKGVSPNFQRAKPERDPLHWASFYGYDAIVQSLLSKGAKVDAEDEDGWTPLHLACRGGHEVVVRTLLNYGAALNATTSNGDTILHIASQYGREAVVQLLLEHHRVEINATTNEGWTPLHKASLNGHDAVARLLLNNCAAIDPATRNGVTPLHVACQYGRETIVRLLLEHGVKVDATTNDKRTPLCVARQRGHDTIVQILMDNGATPVDAH